MRDNLYQKTNNSKKRPEIAGYWRHQPDTDGRNESGYCGKLFAISKLDNLTRSIIKHRKRKNVADGKINKTKQKAAAAIAPSHKCNLRAPISWANIGKGTVNA